MFVSGGWLVFLYYGSFLFFFFSSRRRHTSSFGDWSSDVCSSDLEQTLKTITGKPVELLFQPHVAPMDRGMLCSIYARPTSAAVTVEKLLNALTAAYDGKPFVRVRPKAPPAVKHVTYTNFCDIHATMYKGRVLLFGALDNLIKGASGQAVQNMNLMFGLDETTGLY